MRVTPRSPIILAFLLGCVVTLGVVYRAQISNVIAEGRPFPKISEPPSPELPDPLTIVEQAAARAEQAVKDDPSPRNQRILSAWRRHLAGLQGQRDAQATTVPADVHAAARARGFVPIYIKAITGTPELEMDVVGAELERQLGEKGITFIDNPEPCAAILTGIMSITKDDPEAIVAIEWTLKTTAGIVTGTVEQKKPIPTATLKETWAEDAPYVAKGATDGLMAMMPYKAANCP